MLNEVAVANFDGRPPIRVAQDKSGSWGALSFGYFIFVQAKKSHSPSGETVRNKQSIHVGIHSHLTTDVKLAWISAYAE